jgi:hypothetical protein
MQKMGQSDSFIWRRDQLKHRWWQCADTSDEKFNWCLVAPTSNRQHNQHSPQGAAQNPAHLPLNSKKSTLN